MIKQQVYFYSIFYESIDGESLLGSTIVLATIKWKFFVSDQDLTVYGNMKRVFCWSEYYSYNQILIFRWDISVVCNFKKCKCCKKFHIFDNFDSNNLAAYRFIKVIMIRRGITYTVLRSGPDLVLTFAKVM